MPVPAAICALAFSIPTLIADTLRVPSQYPTIQAAIDAARQSDTVLVADGTYTGPGNRDLDFGGKAIIVRSENGPGGCIIQPQGDPLEPHRGFNFHSGETAAAVVEGFTITGGYELAGGAIFCDQAGPTIRNCVLFNNGAGRGAGLYCRNSSPTLIECLISQNAGRRGAGVCLYWSNPTFVDCSISDNVGGDALVGDDGGGVFCYSSSPTFEGCHIAGNQVLGPSSASRGGGIYCYYFSDITLNRCTLEGNRANEGGGLYCERATATLTGCRLIGNRAGDYGGGLRAVDQANVTVTDSTFRGNESSLGGGVQAYYATATIARCTFVNNRARSAGGAVHSQGTPLNMSHCLLAENEALGSAGGLACVDASSVTVTNCTLARNRAAFTAGAIRFHEIADARLTNCILWDNRAPDGAQLVVSRSAQPSTATVSYCDVDGGQAAVLVEPGCTLNWGAGNIDADPIFALPRDEHLVPGSPCIDAGTNSPPAGLGAGDRDGNTCPLDGDGNGTATADMGAFEFNPASPSLAISPGEVEFFTPLGVNPPDQSIVLRNCGGGALNWEIAEACPWLSANPLAGQSAGEIDQVTLVVNAAGLTHGDYTCELTVNDPQAVNTPRTVRVTLHVNVVWRVPRDQRTIQAAIDASVDGDTIVVADGTYTGAGNKNIYFGGREVVVRSEGGPSNCVIDCQGDGRGFSFIGGEGRAAVLDGFRIVNGTYTGGGVRIWYGSPTIRNCIIAHHTAGRAAGVELVRSGALLLNCVITGNTATTFDGGGLHCRFSVPEIINCTVAGNTAARLGGGIYADGTDTGTIANSIFWGNSPADEFGSAAVSYCATEQAVAGPGNISADPLFLDPAGGDYHVAPDSPVIDAGSNLVVPAGTSGDADGQSRFVDNPCAADTGNGLPPLVDMGAYEFQLVCLADLDGNGVVDLADLGVLLADFGCRGGAPQPCPGDIDCDDDTDRADLGILLASFGSTCP